MNPQHLPLVFAVGLTITATTIAFSIQPLAGLTKTLPSNDLCICPATTDYVGLSTSVSILAIVVYATHKLFKSSDIELWKADST